MASNGGSRRMGEFSPMVYVACLVLCYACLVRSDESNHQYKAKEPVPFYANKVGPFHNPSETYSYYSLPFCSSGQVKEKKASLGEVLNGDRLVSAPYKLEFRVNKDSEVACTTRLTTGEVSQFRSAVAHDYYTQMFYDDLPIWAFIGKVDRSFDTKLEDDKYCLYTHISFEILYNNDRVIEIAARTVPQSTVDLTEDKEVDVKFVYSVNWKETKFRFEERMNKYYLSSKLPHHMSIHWFSVMNSCVTVLVLLGCLVTFYFRVLKKDFNKYINDEEVVDNQEEKGWKNIHGDVFRFPKHKSLFAAAVGSGTQLIILMLCIILLGVLGVFRPYGRGTVLTGLVVIYTVTSGIAGYVAVSLYRQLEGTNWVQNLLLTGSLFFGPLLITFGFLNSLAATYKATAALPLGTILILSCIYFFGALPLLLLGGIMGKNNISEFEAPCRIMKSPRQIPALRWYRGVFPQMVLAGILPFGVMLMELNFLFASVWGHRIYTIYLILLLVVIILILITAFVTIALTYFQLAAEDHKWWWRSFLYGASTGLYLYGYCVHYYYQRSDMSGFMQTSFFFGYMACVSYALFLMLGTVGFYASLLFVRHIYGSIKCE